jgi:hypothetical protein
MEMPTDPGLEQQQVRPAPPARIGFILGMLGIAVALFLAWLRAWLWSYGNVNAEMLGYAAGGAILPALIAYWMAGRKRVRNFSRFGLWFASLSAVSFALMTPRPVSFEQHIANLAMEAAGTKPEDHRGSTGMDGALRTAMRDIFSERKAFEQETGQLAPELGKLYSVQSFSKKQAMQKSLDAVRGVAAADQRYSQQLETLPERLRAKLSSSGLSEYDASEFAKGVRSAYGNSKVLSIRRQAAGVESQWADATVALYEFAIANAARIRVQDNRLVIGDEKVRTAFNEQMKSAQAFRDSLVAANDQLERAERQSLQGAGLTPAQLGLESAKKP